MKIYLDVCCLNRPFDDQAQERIRLEAEAVLLILARLQNEDWTWFSSEVVMDEIEQTPDAHRRARVRQMASHASELYLLTEEDIVRAGKLGELGFASMDALHLVCAESCGAEVFLTTDDRLIRLSNRHSEQLDVSVANPLRWLLSQQESEP